MVDENPPFLFYTLDLLIRCYYINSMSKKIELSKEQIDEVLRLYKEDLFGTPTISERMKIHKTIIIRTLKENGIELGPSGRRNIGGKSVAQKKYESKPEIKKRRSSNYKNWAQDKKQQLRENHSKWREANREHVNEYARNYELNRRRNDPKYRLAARTRTTVWTCLKEANVAKYRSTFETLGYTLEELIAHLEKQFVDGMSWENYGEWHVDHKIPMARFNFTSVDDPEFRLCWCLDNLQPLWGPDNLSKGSRYLC